MESIGFFVFLLLYMSITIKDWRLKHGHGFIDIFQ